MLKFCPEYNINTIRDTNLPPFWNKRLFGSIHRFYRFFCFVFFFSESSPVACQINGSEAKNTMQANILPFYTPTALDQKVKTIVFLKKVMLHIKLKG